MSNTIVYKCHFFSWEIFSDFWSIIITTLYMLCLCILLYMCLALSDLRRKEET